MNGRNGIRVDNDLLLAGPLASSVWNTCRFLAGEMR